MTHRLPILTDDEIPAPPADDQPGFGALMAGETVLPLQTLSVRTRIDGLLARTMLTQTFVNSCAEPIEATYIFPLPDRAAVTQFRMEVAGRVVEGILKERGEARRDYDQTIQSGRRAGITEEERPGVFTLRVGNLMPGEVATIRLTLTGPLVYEAGEATFRFPLVVAPRYIPGTPLPGGSVGDGTALDTDAVPDASRITPPVLLPGFPNPVRLSLSVDLHGGGLPIGAIRSSLHAIAVADNDGVYRIAIHPGERLNRDFILRFRVGAEAVRTSLVLQPDEHGGKEGTFLLTLVPPSGESLPRPRDVVFVLDRSGSMGGWKIVAARRALARMVDTLSERDRFTVYAFDDRIETPAAFGGTGLVAAADRNRFRAVEFLAQIEGRGGTEMAQPLDLAVTRLAGADAQRERILVLVTDGQVGNEDQMLRNLGKRVANLRIFTLGIDQAVNAAFLKRLADLGGGSCELVESEDRLDEVMERIHRRIATPLLTRVEIEPSGMDVARPSLVPGRLPDLFAGAPLFILGRYHGPARGSLTVRASDSTGRSWLETVPASISDDAAVATVWARGHVRELEDRYVTGRGDPNQLMKQIVSTALRFGVLCRFTAFVAVDRKEVVNPGGQVHRVMQPVEQAEGWEMDMMLAEEAEELAEEAEESAMGCVRLEDEAEEKARPRGWLGRLVDGFKSFKKPLKGLEAAPPPHTRGRIANAIASAVPAGPDMVTMGKLPQTPRAKKLLEYATEEANHRNQTIGPEHLLLGLLRIPDCTAATTLLNLGITLEDIRREVLNLMAATPPEAGAAGTFTEAARRVLQLANQEAQRLNHDHIGTEHILLGLMREGTSIAARVLADLESRLSGNPPAAVRREDDFWK